MTWTIRSLAVESDYEFYRRAFTDEAEARSYFEQLVDNAQENGGAGELLCDGKRIASFRKRCPND